MQPFFFEECIPISHQSGTSSSHEKYPIKRSSIHPSVEVLAHMSNKWTFKHGQESINMSCGDLESWEGGSWLSWETRSWKKECSGTSDAVPQETSEMNVHKFSPQPRKKWYFFFFDPSKLSERNLWLWERKFEVGNVWRLTFLGHQCVDVRNSQS